ncbi:hypothetical protein LTR04_001103 [Oleoguttula sp. CCFEE 6159]|nr:hypothetical protein LTR04_001103 [Oleoguttula sp. CCFEE 6159]
MISMGNVGCLGNQVLCKEIQFTMPEFRSMVHGLVTETRRMLMKDLLSDKQGKDVPKILRTPSRDNPIDERLRSMKSVTGRRTGVIVRSYRARKSTSRKIHQARHDSARNRQGMDACLAQVLDGTITFASAAMEQDLVAELQQKLKAAEARAEEEQRRREEEQLRRGEAEARAEEEQHRRKEAEARAAEAQPKTITEYLEACHQLSLDIEVVTDRTLTTQGDTTKPAGRLFPRRIVPWHDFPSQQEKIWEQLSISPSFHSRPAFPSSHQLDYVRTLINPISGELGLRNYERDTVENAVQKLIEEAYKDEQLREGLKLRGTVTFESHTNLGPSRDVSVEELMEQMSISEATTSAGASATAGSEGRQKGRSKDEGNDQTRQANKPAKSKRAGQARGKGNRADQFCIYKQSDGKGVPVVAIEYKAPHKLTVEEIVAGLASEIHPAKDVINQEGDDFIFLSRSLMAAVITQLFSYMIGKGIQYGYVCTGEAFVFLHIPNDPAVVYYSVCVPNSDFEEDDENRLHRTAVAQVFALILGALASEPADQAWHDAAAELDIWAVEYMDILRKIPETIRKERNLSAYKPSRWKGFRRSPIRTRSRCLPAEDSRRMEDEDDDEGDDAPPTPTPARSTRSSKNQRSSQATKQKGARKGVQRGVAEGSTSGQNDGEKAPRPRVEDRPYCTHQCLFGLAHGGSLDRQCPNVQDHKTKHIRRATFLRLVRAQLAKDRGRDADCKPLYIHGSRGALFKIRLSSHGYTFVAKAMEETNLAYLRHENRVYDHIRPLQGMCVPVCLGAVDLELPYYYDCGVYVRMLFLSWAGRPVFDYMNRDRKEHLLDKLTEALQALHKLQVLHEDAEPRNMLFDGRCDRLMLVDLERAKIRVRQPLGVIAPNQKRKRVMEERKMVPDKGFDLEVRYARACLSRCIR